MAQMFLNNKLEIVIFTYNRSQHLYNTLSCLASSPLSGCRVTVLNNHSTDNTESVAKGFDSQFPHYNIITNKINIGGNANLLRAVEVAISEYVWIMADDDEYDFSDCEDVVRRVRDGDVCLIHVGAHTDMPWSFGGYEGKIVDAINLGYPYFKYSSFIPCNIFKRERFLPYIIDGYNNCANLYPHMPFFLSIYKEENIYISKKQIVKAALGGQGYSLHDGYDGWVNTCSKYLKGNDYLLSLMQQFDAKTHRDLIYTFVNTSIVYKTRLYPLLLTFEQLPFLRKFLLYIYFVFTYIKLNIKYVFFVGVRSE